MKKILSTLLVAMFTMVAMNAMAIDPPIIIKNRDYFTITNNATTKSTNVSVNDFSSWIDGNLSYTVNLEGGVYKGENIEITYHNLTFWGTPYLTWFYGWNASNSGSFGPLEYKGTGVTQVFTMENIPTNANKLIVKCNYRSNEQSEETKTYIIYLNVSSRNRITVKNSNASEVQVSYTNYEDVASYAGQRATVALYDIYGNKVSGGYLDAFGTSTLSTKGKPGIYIVKVIMNNQVIFNQRIQVK
ncbi:MAG: hypothetical protein K2I66_06075 [Bacteroidales bacterium]|nr:hypothetical protein [Bacteroidales bacterium]